MPDPQLKEFDKEFEKMDEDIDEALESSYGRLVAIALNKAVKAREDEDGDEAMKWLGSLKKVVNDSLQKVMQKRKKDEASYHKKIKELEKLVDDIKDSSERKKIQTELAKARLHASKEQFDKANDIVCSVESSLESAEVDENIASLDFWGDFKDVQADVKTLPDGPVRNKLQVRLREADKTADDGWYSEASKELAAIASEIKGINKENQLHSKDIDSEVRKLQGEITAFPQFKKQLNAILAAQNKDQFTEAKKLLEELEKDLKEARKVGKKDEAEQIKELDAGIKELQTRIAACPPDLKKGLEKSLNSIKILKISKNFDEAFAELADLQKEVAAIKV
jgi:ATP/maltotriose-dependent transcriptional regulator MalT